MKKNFKFLNKLDDKIIADFISNELTQTIVIILLNLKKSKIKKILSYFPKNIQEEIINAMENRGQIHTPSFKIIGKFLKKKLQKINKNYIFLNY